MAVNRSLACLMSSSVALLLVFAQGCDSDPQGPAPFGGGSDDVKMLGERGNMYLQYVDLLAKVDTYFCTCEIAEGNYTDMTTCIAAIGGPPIPPPLAQCYAEVIDTLPSEQKFVECQVAKYMLFTDCLSQVPCGGDRSECDKKLTVAPCPKMSYEANMVLAESCLGYEIPPAFECADGTQIVPWNECNFTPDCPDGSDEHEGCPEGFMCASGDNIPKAWVCDGGVDCPDADDEADCEAP